MSETKSYFLAPYGRLSFINICDRKPHLAYAPPAYKEDSLMARIRRSGYCSEVNEWLNYPFINSEYWSRIEREERELERQENDLYYNEVNEHLQYEPENDWDDMVQDDNRHKNYDDSEEEEELKVKNICLTMYNDIVRAVNQSGFQINDLNQFKEDFIHYMYTLSENKKPKL